MHIPDGFIDGPTSLGAAGVAVAGVSISVRKAADALDDRRAPLAGLVAAFVFAVQMLNFPVLPGVSGHLLGGALATLLVGPWLAILCVAVVLLVQGLLFADGGLTALGLNITNMGIVTSLVAAALVVLLVRRYRPSPRTIWVTAFVVAFVSVLVGASTFVLEYALGGTLSISIATVATLQLGYHVLIGIGEGLITAMTVATVAATRPDLVWALRRHAPRPQADELVDA
jgi:cobalt/nickel transport system permease protein